MGFFSCSVHNCKIPLESTKDRFCPTHAYVEKLCSIVGCDDECMEGSRACDDPIHQAAEANYKAKGKASFMLNSRLARTRATNRASAAVEEVGIEELEEDSEEELPVPLNNDGTPVSLNELDADAVAHVSGEKQLKIRARFGRQRTHNEQIIVAPCGVIIARETFYGAEAISGVAVSGLMIGS